MEEFLEANRTFFKFMFVRHPMKRMLSCYMDKMVKSEHKSLPPYRIFVKNKGRKIIQDREDAAVLKREEIPKQSTSITKNISNVTIDRQQVIGNQSSNATAIIPTFEEFLEFILSTNLQGKIFFHRPTNSSIY